MSRQVYTYADLTKLKSNKNFMEIMKYPQITVSSDLRKCLNGTLDKDRVQGMFTDTTSFRVTEFHSFASTIDQEWNTDRGKFRQMLYLSEFVRGKMEEAGSDSKLRNWLLGCMRNLDSMLSAIILLEQAAVTPDQLNAGTDRNIKFFLDAWRFLEKKDATLVGFRKRMNEMTTRQAWEDIFQQVFQIDSLNGIDTVVFHGFYYITPHQERVMGLLEQAGFKLIYLIPYDERFPFVHEIWDETYSEERGYEPKCNWHLDRSAETDVYGELFEGRKVSVSNKLAIKEYASVTEFVDDIVHIREKGYSIYSADAKSANKLLKDYFPSAYGDRKILSYPIGQFISALNKMWDEEKQTIAIDEDGLFECFASGWLAVDGIPGKRYLQDLMYVLPFFSGCHTIDEWEKRIELFKKIEDDVISPFETELDPDESVSRWQEAIGSPLKNFSPFAVTSDKLEVILRLIKQLLDTARDLFGNNELIRVQEHVRKLDWVLKRLELSQELYLEERALVNDIFEVLGTDNAFDDACHPADIAKALELFICGRYEEGEIQTYKVGLVYPLFFVDAACVKNKSKVHLCMSDINTLPGGNKDYIWPLTEKKVKEIYEKTKNPLVLNLMQIMNSTALCNRFFTYCALKNKEVTISWISTMGDKKLAPSPYIKLLLNGTDVKLTPAARNAITFERVLDAPMSPGRVLKYDNNKAPLGMIKEARMDYALCPMKYILGYVVEKYPAYQSEFQMNYALNAFISAMYNLMKDQGMKVDDAFEAAVSLFPNMRKVEKRQVYDYISYDHRENDMDYGIRTECGGKFYTDERLKIHYPNQDVRAQTIEKYARLSTPDGRRGMNLYEAMEVENACVYCQHINYCRNAVFAGDQENCYD